MVNPPELYQWARRDIDGIPNHLEPGNARTGDLHLQLQYPSEACNPRRNLVVQFGLGELPRWDFLRFRKQQFGGGIQAYLDPDPKLHANPKPDPNPDFHTH